MNQVSELPVFDDNEAKIKRFNSLSELELYRENSSVSAGLWGVVVFDSLSPVNASSGGGSTARSVNERKLAMLENLNFSLSVSFVEPGTHYFFRECIRRSP